MQMCTGLNNVDAEKLIGKICFHSSKWAPSSSSVSRSYTRDLLTQQPLSTSGTGQGASKVLSHGQKRVCPGGRLV